jgi:hypothetical protein
MKIMIIYCQLPYNKRICFRFELLSAYERSFCSHRYSNNLTKILLSKNKRPCLPPNYINIPLLTFAEVNISIYSNMSCYVKSVICHMIILSNAYKLGFIPLISYKSYITGDTSGTGTAYPSGTPEFTSGFKWVLCCHSPIYCF